MLVRFAVRVFGGRLSVCVCVFLSLLVYGVGCGIFIVFVPDYCFSIYVARKKCGHFFFI